MFKKSIALSILGMFIAQTPAPAISAELGNSVDLPQGFDKHGKGQLRQAKSKQSGAASLKRAAKKAKNISKRKSKRQF